MARTYETVTVKSYYFTLSRIIWRRFKKPMPGLVEETLGYNAGLASLGPYLPIGTTFSLPIPDESQSPVIPLIRLWD